jgi:serine O-acetyltransferase
MKTVNILQHEETATSARIGREHRKETSQPSLWQLLRQDWADDPFPRTLAFTILGFGPHRAQVIYRLSSALHRKRVPLLPNMLRWINITLHGCDISPAAEVGGGTRFVHTIGVVVEPWVRVGRNCRLFQNITLGAEGPDSKSDQPTSIGDNVMVYSGAVLVRGVSVGDGAAAAANSVVTEDVPPGVLVGGVPARFIRTVDNTNSVHPGR